MATVIIPNAINVIVAKTDLFDNLEIPQTPCPEVQPPPSLVPKPTKRPASIVSKIFKFKL